MQTRAVQDELRTTMSGVPLDMAIALTSDPFAKVIGLGYLRGLANWVHKDTEVVPAIHALHYCYTRHVRSDPAMMEDVRATWLLIKPEDATAVLYCLPEHPNATIYQGICSSGEP
jgi:hypothetical protein